jgi:hypothetical protein
MEEDLIAQLLPQPALSAVIGRELTWSIRNPGGSLPALVLHLISGRPDYTTKGASGLTPYLIQMDALGATAAEALAVKRGLVLALGQLGRPFLGVGFVEDERADFSHDAEPDAGGATDLFRQSLDVRLWHLSTP